MHTFSTPRAAFSWPSLLFLIIGLWNQHWDVLQALPKPKKVNLFTKNRLTFWYPLIAQQIKVPEAILLQTETDW